MKKYKSFIELKEAVKNGFLVNWQNGQYYVKLDFYGDYVVKCTSNPMQEILSDKFNINDFYTN